MNVFIREFDRQFADLDAGFRSILAALPDDKLFQRPQPAAAMSTGELVLRGAGKIEQTFGGITSRLWDDPFEWTLPEELSTKAKILEYLDEVEQTRQKGFSYFKSDEELKKELPAPETLVTIFELMLETVVCASKYLALAEYAVSEASRRVD